jgi:hypothetical protein
LAAQPIIYIVCSDRHRNGKTRWPGCWSIISCSTATILLSSMRSFRKPLRAFSRPHRIDFDQMQGRMKLFDTILESPGRDYVIDLPAPQTGPFFQAVTELGFADEARTRGFSLVVLFIVDRTGESLKMAADIARNVKPDLLVPVRNAHVGSALDDTDAKLPIDMPVLDPPPPPSSPTGVLAALLLLGDEVTCRPSGGRLKSFHERPPASARSSW